MESVALGISAVVCVILVLTVLLLIGQHFFMKMTDYFHDKKYAESQKKHAESQKKHAESIQRDTQPNIEKYDDSPTDFNTSMQYPQFTTPRYVTVSA